MTYKQVKDIFRKQSSAFAGLCLFLIGCLFIQCSDTNEPGPNPEPTGPTLVELRENLAVHYADNHILQSITELNIAVSQLESSNSNFQSNPSLSTLMTYKLSLRKYGSSGRVRQYIKWGHRRQMPYEPH